MSPFSSDDFPTLPSMPTMCAGDARDALGRIDHYDLLRKLGGGGFGVVYLARDTASGVEVAIKTLHPLLKTNAEEMDALREKFRLVHALTHPNIAKALVLHPVRDINVWDEGARQELRLTPGDSVMVMDYAPGATLSKWRRQFPDGVVPLDQTLEIGRQLASALDYAHGERIVHRDVKPANVMVETLCVSTTEKTDNTEAGAAASVHSVPSVVLKVRVRILDFGLAAEIRSSMSRVSTETGDTSGTRPFMAPEQWLGRKQDGRTDQYALACVLYELLSGAPPFAGVFETGDPVIMANAVENKPPEEIEGVPPHVNAALQKALAKNPKDRFPSCGAFVAALAASTNPESRLPARIPAPETRIAQAAPPFEPTSAALEADVLRRKVSFSRVLKSLSGTDRGNATLAGYIQTAEDEMVVVEEACRFGRFAAAAESLDRVESALDELREARTKVEAERKAREEAERKAREEAKRKAREEAQRRACEETKRKAREEAGRIAGARAEQIAGEESHGKVQGREEEQRRRASRSGVRAIWIVALFSALIGCVFYCTKHDEKQVLESQESNGTVRMITEATFPPYEFRQGKEVVGIDVEICKAIAKALGKELKIEDVEFDSVIPSLIAGKAELAAAGITVNEDRKKQVDFSVPYVRTGIVFIFAKDKPFSEKKPEEARGKKIGVQNGTISADYVRKDLGQEPEVFDTPASAFAALKAGKVDVMIADIDPAKAVIKGQDGYDISDLLTVEEYAVAIKKGQPELLATINKVIQDLIVSGELDKITDRMTAKANAMAAAE